MVLLPKQLTIALLALLLPLVGGCSSKLISAPGIKGRFIEGSTGQPIAGARVRYTNIGESLTKESITDADGRFVFQPEFTEGYAGYPAAPVGLRVRLQLMIKDKHSFSAVYPAAGNPAYPSVKNTAVNDAMIDAGDIKVDRSYLIP
jgi:hypothetical protein